MSCVLIGGGSRSGKSRFALEYARRYAMPLAFVATAEARDDEMRQRVATHQAERGSEFAIFEEPMDPARVILESGNRFGAIVLDCLTLWLSNQMLSGTHDIHRRAADLLRVVTESPARVLLVTNEVGCGIVPENALARQFRDLAGFVNQQAAAAADEVYWMTFGIATRIK